MSKQKLIIFWLLVVWASTTFAQKECGTKTLSEAAYNKILSKVSFKETPQLESVKYIRVFICDILSTNGVDSAWTRQQINNEFQLAKDLLKPYNICLVLEGVEYIQNSSFLDFNTDNIATLQAVSYHADCLNMYLHRTLTSANSGNILNGVAYTVGGLRMSLSQGALGQRSMAHEVGHCFGLLHTFETSFGLECPDGSNNSTAGDKIPDTRATPDAHDYLKANTNSSCIYSGNLTLTCNGSTQLYNPEIINLMSYGRRECRNMFSTNQVSLMHTTILGPAVSPASINLVNTVTISNTTQNNDVVYIADIIQLGNNSAITNTFLGQEARQRYLAQQRIVITPGVKISATNRTKVIIKATPICDELLKYSF